MDLWQLRWILLIFCVIRLGLASAQKVLIVGSTASFHSSTKAFSPIGIANELDTILTASGKSHSVVVDDIFTNSPAFRHSLVQYFFWPSQGLKSVLADEKWDYVVAIEDAYVAAKMPGVHAEGIYQIGRALGDMSKLLLLVQWPSGNGNSNALAESAYRIAQGSTIGVIPAGPAWDSLKNKDDNGGHPSSEGAFLAACSIFSHIHRAAFQTSDARKSTISQHAFDTVQSESAADHVTGPSSLKYPFSMQNNKNRNLTSIHFGSSTEQRIINAFNKIIASNGLLHKNYKFCRLGEGACPGKNFETPPQELLPLDFNIGRANFETFKRFVVSPTNHDVAMGFAFQDSNPSAWLYTIDRYRSNGAMTTDFDIALSMILNNRGALTLPLRLLYAKLSLLEAEHGDFGPLDADGRHLNDLLNEAAASYLFTTLLGRCQLGSKPSKKGTSLKQWLARQVGYETAWRMEHMMMRVPGMEMKSSKTSRTEVTTSQSYEIEVRFRFRPDSDVVVKASSPGSTFTIASADLRFTRTNYGSTQKIQFNVPSTTAKKGSVVIVTQSTDPVFDGISDSIEYSIVAGQVTVPTPFPTTRVVGGDDDDGDDDDTTGSTPFPSKFPTPFPSAPFPTPFPSSSAGAGSGPTPFPSSFPTPFPQSD